MSDLIEKLKQRIREIASCPHADYRNEFYGSLGRFVCENSHEILSALETVWGIEELSKCGFVRIENGIMNRWYVTTNREWRRSDQQETDGPTLSAAIEAARKGM